MQAQTTETPRPARCVECNGVGAVMNPAYPSYDHLIGWTRIDGSGAPIGADGKAIPLKVACGCPVGQRVTAGQRRLDEYAAGRCIETYGAQREAGIRAARHYYGDEATDGYLSRRAPAPVAPVMVEAAA